MYVDYATSRLIITLELIPNISIYPNAFIPFNLTRFRIDNVSLTIGS